MTLAVKRPTRLPYATVLAAALLVFHTSHPASAGHDHSICPDYPQYKEVLNEGQSLLESVGSGKALRGEGNIDDRTWSPYFGYKEPKLYQYALTAARAEAAGNISHALCWWNGLADLLKSRTGEEHRFAYARVLSRIADLNLLASRPDVSDDLIEPPYLTWLEAHQKNVEISGREMKDGKPGQPIIKQESPSYQGEPPGIRGLSTDPVRRHLAFSVPMLDLRLKGRLFQLFQHQSFSESQSLSGQANSPRLPALRDVARQYEKAIEIRKRLSDGGCSPHCVLDVIKLALIAKSLGENETSKIRMDEALLMFRASPAEPSPFLADDYNQASLCSSPLLYIIVTKELVSHALRSNEHGVTEIDERQFVRFFPGRWAPTAMQCCAAVNDKQSVLRLYQNYGTDVLSMEAAGERAVLERVKVAEALVQVDAKAELFCFCELWKTRIPADPIGRAYQDVALAELALKQKDKDQAVDCFKVAFSELSRLKDLDEYLVRAQYRIAAKIEGNLAKTKDAQLVPIRTAAKKLKGEASHRLMQLDCIALAKRLSETGAKLRRQGKLDAASKLFEASLDIKAKNLGAENIETTRQQIEAAQLMSLSGRLEEAREALSAATEALRRGAYRDDPLYKRALENYADVLSKLDKSNEAEKIYVELRGMD